MRTSRLVVLTALYAASVSAAGCGPSAVVQTGDVNPGDLNLATIGRMYSAAERQLGRPPRNADELKPHLPAGADLRQLLVSPNDNQPFVIVWGVKLTSTPDQSTVVAYEQVGANGYRRVLTPSGTLMLSYEDFAKATFPPGHSPGRK